MNSISTTHPHQLVELLRDLASQNLNSDLKVVEHVFYRYSSAIGRGTRLRLAERCAVPETLFEGALVTSYFSSDVDLRYIRNGS